MNAETPLPVAEHLAVTRRFAATATGVQCARRWAVDQLSRWGLPTDAEEVDAVRTVVAELAANAVTHGRAPGRECELRLVQRRGVILIEVSDASTERWLPRPPVTGPPSPEAECGRGLLLVQALSLSWGVATRQVGKTVWAEVSAGPDPWTWA